VKRLLGLALTAVVVLGACGDDYDPAASAASTTSAAPTTSTSLPPVSTRPEPAPTTDLVDGRHPAHIVSVDAAQRRITVDVVQFLTGEAADRAAVEDGYVEPGEGVPNDYYVRNVNDRLRTLTVAPDAPVTVTFNDAQDVSAERTVTLDELGRYWTTHEEYQTRGRIFWVILVGGTVTRLEHQYVP
jgi:hypothetical protein